MPTELPRIFLHWRHADQVLLPDTLDWAVVHADALLQTGVGISALHAQLAALQTAVTNPGARTADSKHVPFSTTLIIPAEATLITAVTVPSTKLQHIQAAVPHLMEEWSAAELDTLHIALGPRASDGTVITAAIDRALLTRWLHAVDDLGLRCEQVWIDATVLPAAPNTLTVYLDQHRILLRGPEHFVGAIASDTLEPVLAALQHHHPFQHIAWQASAVTPPEAIERLQDTWVTLRQRTSITLERHASTDDFWPVVIENLARPDSAPLNLRQGDLALVDRHCLLWRRWRPTALVAGVCVVALLLLNLIGGAWLNHRAAAVHAQNAALYRELFPQDKRLVNVGQQFRAHLASSSAGGRAAFFSVFGQLALAMKNQPTEPPLRLRSLLFDANSGALQVELIAPNVQTVDTLQKQLGTQHLRTKVLSAANENGSLVGRLSISEGS